MTTIPGTAIPFPCVSTQWLAQRGLQRAVLRSSGPSEKHVLCIPDQELPCGTPGHLLRNFDTGKLASYQTVCEMRGDCIRTSMPVSQLSHNYDWAVYRTGMYELTSLSAHPETKSPFSPSRILAAFVDTLNKAGMGRICDAFILLTHQILVKLPALATAHTLSR